jgi:uncharacterized protein
MDGPTTCCETTRQNGLLSVEAAKYGMNTSENLPPSDFFPLRAAIFEAALAVLAVLFGWLLGQSPLDTLKVNPYAVSGGILAAWPILGLLFLARRLEWRPLSKVWRIMDELVVPLFRHCNWVELAAISFLAGVGEEMLFRGIFQAGMVQWSGDFLPHTHFAATVGDWIAIVAVAIAFGLMHAVNLTYAVLAALIGIYLGWLWTVTGNLTVPIMAHAFYDFVALTYLVHGRK